MERVSRVNQKLKIGKSKKEFEVKTWNSSTSVIGASTLQLPVSKIISVVWSAKMC